MQFVDWAGATIALLMVFVIIDGALIAIEQWFRGKGGRP